jgi:hypothetical protein
MGLLIVAAFIIFLLDKGNTVVAIFVLFLFIGIFVIDVISMLDFNKRITTYNVDKDSIITMKSNSDIGKLKFEYYYNFVRIPFIALSSIFLIPLFYNLIDSSHADQSLQVFYYTLTVVMCILFILLFIDEVIHPYNKLEVNFIDFRFKYKGYLKRIILILFESAAFITYTFMLFYGKDLVSNGLYWIVIIFPLLLVAASYDLYYSGLKLLATYDLNVE